MSEPRGGLRDPVWQFIGVVVTVIFGLVSVFISVAHPIIPAIASGILILLPIGAFIYFVPAARQPTWTNRSRLLALVGLALSLVAGVLALARFWPLIGAPILGRLLGLTPWVLAFGVIALLGLTFVWRSRRESLKRPAAESINRVQLMLVAWVLLGAFAFGDQIQIWWFHLQGIDTIALLGDIEDEATRTNVARLCQDSELSRVARIRFICSESVPSPQLDADMGALLEDYRLNRSLAGLIWIGAPMEQAANQPDALLIRRRPFLAEEMKDIPLVPYEASAWSSVSQAIMEHASLVKCAQGRSQEVVALARAWRDGAYAAGDSPSLYYPAYLRCFAESALDAQAFLAFDDMRAESMHGIGDAWANLATESSDGQRYGLTYARLLLYSGQLDEAQDILDQMDRRLKADGTLNTQYQSARRKVLAELKLSRCQSDPDDTTREQECQSAQEGFSALLQVQPSRLARYGLGRAQVLLSLYRSDDEATALRQAAMTVLRLAQLGRSPSCLKQNVDRWIEFAQALGGKSTSDDQAMPNVSAFAECQFGVNVNIPLAVSSEVITATIGLPAPGLHYAVVPLDYSDSAALKATALTDMRQGLYQAQFVLPGPPDDPIRFVYHNRVPKPHIELQKAFQIGIQSQTGDKVLDVFPLVMYGQTALEVNHASAEPIRLTVGDALTTTAWIAGKLPLMDGARILNDAAILGRLTFCSASEGELPDIACREHPLEPAGQAGYYQDTRFFSEPGGLPLKVIAVDRSDQSNVIILQSRTFTVEVAAPPPPEAEHDEVVVAILAKGPLLWEAGEGDRVRYGVPNCAGVIVLDVGSEGSWYHVRYQVSGLPISGWAPVENILLVRVFEREHLPALAIVRTPLDIYPRHGVSAYQVPECTLLELTDRPEAGRWKVKIYADRESEPDQGWIDPDQPGIETLLLPEP